jgi:hypothetical protein
MVGLRQAIQNELVTIGQLVYFPDGMIADSLFQHAAESQDLHSAHYTYWAFDQSGY